jgi:hypothetical protein
MTVLTYDRSFSSTTAKPGDTIQVRFNVSFIAPPAPSVNCWFDNIGDNLGGSNPANGPLSHVYLSEEYSSQTNLRPPTLMKAWEGNPAGCVRFWCQGPVWPSTYPSSTGSYADVWRPLNFNSMVNLTIIQNFTVVPNAVPGTVIGPPTRASPCDDSNITAGKLMIDLGSDMVLHINTGSAPPGWSRTLTIVP